MPARPPVSNREEEPVLPPRLRVPLLCSRCVGAAWVSIAVAAAVSGCGPSSSSNDCSADDDPQPCCATGGKTSGDVSVQVVDGPAFRQALERHRGKVVLVDFWATWCKPCIEGFPHVVELHRRHADRGLVVIAVSMDEPKDKERVEKFLVKQGAAFDALLSRYGMGSEAAEVFGVGALPHYRLYDRQGKLVKDFASGGPPLDPREIDRAVEELLE